MTTTNATPTKAICIDRQFCSNPEYIGLENENLLAQSWLEVLENGTIARDALRRRQDINEAWVVSCDDVEPVNLAAALKKDRPELMVRLIVGQANGSLYSRAAVACIDEVVELMRFAQLYAITKSHEMKLAEKLQDVPHTSLQAKQAPFLAGVDSSEQHVSQGSEQRERQFEEQSGKQQSSQYTGQYVSQHTSQYSGQPGSQHEQHMLSLTSTHTPRVHKGFLMSIVSGSGGTGKSSVAALAALYASDRGCRTLLIDLDLQFGDISSMVGSLDSLEIDALIADPERERAIFSQQSNLVVLSAPKRLEMSEELVDQLPRLLDEAMRHFDVVVANTGANWAEQHALLLERSSVALFLLDQRGSSIRACHHALELCARCGIASVPFKFALNRCSKTAPFNAADVSSVMQGAPIFELKDGGAEVEEYLASGHIRELCMQGNEFVKSIDRMMNKLLPATETSVSQQFVTHEPEQKSGRRRMRFGRKHAKVVA